MTDTLIDTNVLLDVLAKDSQWFAWSSRMLADALDQGSVVINPIVYAEIAPGYGEQEALDEILSEHPFVREDLPWDAAFRAGQVYLAYRRRGGVRTAPLPDFFIGAHAALRGYRLLTRDRGNYAVYFPELTIISPERS
jgi:predicted nucleic acid-binding protein